MGFGSTAGDQSEALAQQQQTNLNQALSQINSAFAGFNPSYYSNIQKEYENFATPQLMQQYQGNLKNLQGNLSSQGLTRSSAASQLTGALNQNLAAGERGIADTGLQQAQQFQGQVQQQQNQLVNQAEISSDPLAIAQGALSTAASITPPSQFAPVGNLLSNWSNFYQADQQNNAVNLYNTQLNAALTAGLAGSGGGFSPASTSGVIR